MTPTISKWGDIISERALLKFKYSEKATKFCEISMIDLSYVRPVKSIVEILQNFVAFLVYMNFIFIYLSYHHKLQKIQEGH